MNRLNSARELLQSVLEDSEWMRIEIRRAVPSDWRVFVIELEVTGSKVRMIGVLVKAKQ